MSHDLTQKSSLVGEIKKNAKKKQFSMLVVKEISSHVWRINGYKWVFPKIIVPQNGWCIRENPIKMDDFGVPLLLETPM